MSFIDKIGAARRRGVVGNAIRSSQLHKYSMEPKARFQMPGHTRLLHHESGLDLRPDKDGYFTAPQSVKDHFCEQGEHKSEHARRKHYASAKIQATLGI